MELEKLIKKAVKILQDDGNTHFDEIRFNTFKLPGKLTLGQTQKVLKMVNERHYFSYRIILEMPYDNGPILKWDANN